MSSQDSPSAALPRIVIVGRPNVGKSSLLNRLAGRRVSIVDPTAGTTRDRVETVARIKGEAITDEWPVRLVDTGGYGIVDRDDLAPQVERQIDEAIRHADLILFVVDAQAGVTPLDEKFAAVLRSARTEAGADHRPVQLVVNKVDDDRFEPQAWEFLRLGFGEPVAVSAETRHGIRELHGAVCSHINFKVWKPDRAAADEGVRIAIVGKRNAGKSTLVNALVGEERVIVSEKAGTTRDSVDVRMEWKKGKKSQVVTLIDTAGLRKTKSLADDIEFYSQHRSLRSVRRADVCMLMIDATLPLSQVDGALVGEIHKHWRPTVIVVNKWDLVESKHSTDEYVEYLGKELRGLAYAPIVFVSAIHREKVKDLLDVALDLNRQAKLEVVTQQFQEAVHAIIKDQPPKTKTGKQLRVYAAAQVACDPPTIRLTVNDAELLSLNYLAFLENRLRETMPWGEIPIRMQVDTRVFKSKAMDDEKRAAKHAAAKDGAEPADDHLHHKDSIEADDWEGGGEDYGAGD